MMRRVREKQEKWKKVDNFKDAACCPSAVVQRAARRKNDVYEGSARDSLDPRESQQPFRSNPNWVGNCTITLRWLLIGADKTSWHAKMKTVS